MTEPRVGTFCDLHIGDRVHADHYGTAFWDRDTKEPPAIVDITLDGDGRGTLLFEDGKAHTCQDVRKDPGNTYTYSWGQQDDELLAGDCTLYRVEITGHHAASGRTMSFGWRYLRSMSQVSARRRVRTILGVELDGVDITSKARAGLGLPRHPGLKDVTVPLHIASWVDRINAKVAYRSQGERTIQSIMWDLRSYLEQLELVDESFGLAPACTYTASKEMRRLYEARDWPLPLDGSDVYPALDVVLPRIYVQRGNNEGYYLHVDLVWSDSQRVQSLFMGKYLTGPDTVWEAARTIAQLLDVSD
jgi:hypothetical protein